MVDLECKFGLKIQHLLSQAPLLETGPMNVVHRGSNFQNKSKGRKNTDTLAKKFNTVKYWSARDVAIIGTQCCNAELSALNVVKKGTPREGVNKRVWNGISEEHHDKGSSYC